MRRTIALTLALTAAVAAVAASSAFGRPTAGTTLVGTVRSRLRDHAHAGRQGRKDTESRHVHPRHPRQGEHPRVLARRATRIREGLHDRAVRRNQDPHGRLQGRQVQVLLPAAPKGRCSATSPSADGRSACGGGAASPPRAFDLAGVFFFIVKPVQAIAARRATTEEEVVSDELAAAPGATRGTARRVDRGAKERPHATQGARPLLPLSLFGPLLAALLLQRLLRSLLLEFLGFVRALHDERSFFRCRPAHHRTTPSLVRASPPTRHLAGGPCRAAERASGWTAVLVQFSTGGSRGEAEEHGQPGRKAGERRCVPRVRSLEWPRLARLARLPDGRSGECEPPALAFYCRACSEREFGAR